jgi:hypothetical protein
MPKSFPDFVGFPIIASVEKLDSRLIFWTFTPPGRIDRQRLRFNDMIGMARRM